MTAVIGLFDRNIDAEQAISELEQSGVEQRHLSVLARDRFLRQRMVGGDAVVDDTAEGLAGGAAVGGLAGLLAAATALVLPGLGPVVAAGSLATLLSSTVAGAGVGALTGSVIGALTGLGVTEKEAQSYAEAVKRGGVLLAIDVPSNRVGEVWQIMRQSNAVDIDARRSEWERGGWFGFDEREDPDDHYPRI